jgi:hypothetical protein
MDETDVPNWLNSSFLETALRSGGYGPSVTVTSIEIGRATGAGDNYSSDIYRAKLRLILEGRRSTVSLIVKAQPEKGEISKVIILFCIMIYISDIRRVLNRKTLSIFLLNNQLLLLCIYVIQICILM